VANGDEKAPKNGQGEAKRDQKMREEDPKVATDDQRMAERDQKMAVKTQKGVNEDQMLANDGQKEVNQGHHRPHDVPSSRTGRDLTEGVQKKIARLPTEAGNDHKEGGEDKQSKVRLRKTENILLY